MLIGENGKVDPEELFKVFMHSNRRPRVAANLTRKDRRKN